MFEPGSCAVLAALAAVGGFIGSAFVIGAIWPTERLAKPISRAARRQLERRK
jgi:hypothetical protein